MEEDQIIDAVFNFVMEKKTSLIDETTQKKTAIQQRGFSD